MSKDKIFSLILEERDVLIIFDALNKIVLPAGDAIQVIAPLLQKMQNQVNDQYNPEVGA